jgi:predicted Zn-ribbon and HTH transcriptional regulator
MGSQCPGQDKRNVTIELLTCAVCGYQVEMFSDEVKVSCPHCKSLVCRQRLPSCADWCKYSRQCLGK